MKFMKLGSKPDTFRVDGHNTRHVAGELATDIVLHVNDVNFFLHKFPLVSKSARLQKLFSSTSGGNVEEIHIHDIPGGSSAFEVCAKFCYGMTVTLNAYNIASVRCAAEYLEMNEMVDRGNLIYKLDVFLNSSILRSWKDSIIFLQTTKSLLPLLEELKLVSHCIDAIATKASVDVSQVDCSYTYNRKKSPEIKENDSSWNGLRGRTVPDDWWVEDLCELEINLYKRVIVAIKNKGLIANEVIGEALKAYAYLNFPSSGNGVIQKNDVSKFLSILDTIVWLLPAEKCSLSCSFLLKLLKAAISIDSSEAVEMELVRRVGQQLEEASVNDLLIRTHERDPLVYDVHMVQKILQEFTIRDQAAELEADNSKGIKGQGILSEASKLMVAKLVDAYLGEIAKDPNLPLSMFINVAEVVSNYGRPSHDCLYRAIDTYLKEHPNVSKSERKKICGLMDCRRLTAEVCLHAVQNDRLPLRVVIQVLFFDQVRAAASSGSSTPDLPKALRDSYGSLRSVTANNEEDWDGAASITELRALRSEVASLRLRNGAKQGKDTAETRISNTDSAAVSKVKSLIISKKIFSKLWSSKSHEVENSESDSSESLGSVNHDDSKYMSAGKGRHSVS